MGRSITGCHTTCRARPHVKSSASIKVGRHAPQVGWAKQNSDGSVNSHGCATGAGWIRDHEGRPRVGYQRKIDAITASNAETWALGYGLYAAKKLMNHTSRSWNGCKICG